MNIPNYTDTSEIQISRYFMFLKTKIPKVSWRTASNV